MTAEQLAQEAAPVVEAAEELVSVAPRTGNSEDLTDDIVSTARTFRAAVASWTGRQAAEVVRGERPYSRWRLYGQELRQQIEAFTKEIQQTGAWWQRAFDALGRSLESFQSKLEAKVTALQSEVRNIGALRDAVMARRDVLQYHFADLSEETLNLYYGDPGRAATAAWDRLVDLTEGLARTVAALRSGTLALERTGDGDVLAVTPDDGLSGAPVVVGLLALVAGAVALAASVRAYYTHADEVTRAEVARLELELVQQGRGAEVTELRKARTEADRARNANGTDPLATAGKVLAGGALLLGGAWGLKALAEHLLARRRAA